MKTIPRRRAFALLLLFVTVAMSHATPDAAAADKKPPTRFYLVGIGPGDPDLMTLRAVKVIGEADVIFCARQWAEKIDTYLKGKQIHYDYWRLFPYYGEDPAGLSADERREYDEIERKRNEFVSLVRGAVKQGKTVAVLDAGDPLVYGPSAWCPRGIRGPRARDRAGRKLFQRRQRGPAPRHHHRREHQVGDPHGRRLARHDRHDRKALVPRVHDGAVHDEDGIRRVHPKTRDQLSARNPHRHRQTRRLRRQTRSDPSDHWARSKIVSATSSCPSST